MTDETASLQNRLLYDRGPLFLLPSNRIIAALINQASVAVVPSANKTASPDLAPAFVALAPAAYVLPCTTASATACSTTACYTLACCTAASVTACSTACYYTAASVAAWFTACSTAACYTTAAAVASVVAC